MGRYRLQIVDDQDCVIMCGLPGAQQPFEVDLIARCIETIAARGIGVLRTDKQVRQAIRDGIAEVLRTYKIAVRPLVQR